MTNSFRRQRLLSLLTASVLVAAACNSGGEKSQELAASTVTAVVEAPTQGAGQTTVLPVTTVTSSAPVSDRVQLTTSTATRYYTVTGTTTTDIFASIDQNGPKENGVKAVGLASSEWSYRMQPQLNPDGTCVISTMTIELDIVVTLPRHANEASLSPQLGTNWDVFEASVAKHEQTHVDIDIAGAQTIRNRMIAIKPAANCDALNNQVEAAWAAEQRNIEAAQDEFHEEDDARIASLREPLQKQIDANRVRIANLLGQIEGLDRSLAVMQSELTNVDSQLDALKVQIDNIEAAYPGGTLPPDVYAEHEELRRIYNALAPSYNQLVSQYNSSIGQRNKVADEHDELVDTTNTLVDQFNWTR